MFGIMLSIFFFFSGLMAVSEALIQNNKFELDSSFDGFVDETNIIRKPNATSTVDCSRQCGRDANCVAFYFTPTTKECRQHSTRSNYDMIGLIEKPNSRYYRIPVVAQTTFDCPVHNGSWCTNQLLDGSTMQYLIVNNVSVNQSDAVAYCDSLDANLPKIITAEKMNFYLNNIIPCVGVNGSKFWIDGTNIDTPNAYKTRDGDNIPQNNNFWAQNSPGDSANQHCIHLIYDDVGYKLDTYGCEIAEHQILCEKITY